ncbi:MAG: TRAP transporter large permease subunit, partial [Pseudomonadota bacterium]
LDFIEITLVVVPLVAPPLLMAGVDPIWLGVLMAVNLQTSFLTPPFGFALFYLRGVAPREVKTTDMYKGVIAFIGLQLSALVIVGLVPPLVNYLPNRVNLTAETAPPPRNPQLQRCLEDYVLAEIEAAGPAIGGTVAAARRLELSYLPEDLAEGLTESFDAAETALRLLPEAAEAGRAKDAAAEAFRPVLRAVR